MLKKVYSILFFILVSYLSVHASIQINNKELRKGTINLSSVNFNNTIFNLEGDAPFVKDTFIYSSNILETDIKFQSISLLKSWNNQVQNLSAHGFGTYSIQIHIPDSLVGETFILRPNHFIAYASKIYAGNNLISYNGNVGKSKSDINYQPSRKTTVIPFKADSSIIQIVVHAANFSHFRGGILAPLHFGLAEHVIANTNRKIFFDLMIIVSLIIMFLYHFVLYFANRSNTVALFFSITCLVFAVDFSFQDTMTFFLLFPDAGFKITSFLHLTMPYLIPGSFIFFLHALFPNESKKAVRNFTGIVALSLVIFTVIFGSALSSVVSRPHFLYVLVLIFYVYWVVIKAYKLGREGAAFFLSAYLIFSLCAINDILFVFDIINSPSLISTGLIVFVFLLSVLQGKRMVEMNKRNEKLSENLQELNINLEQKVAERTLELNTSLEQVKKLNSFKEDMTNMIVHDLKAPLSTVINVKLFKNEDGINMVQQAGYRMLNLVQNMLGVYKHDNAKIVLNKESSSFVSVIELAIDEVAIMAQEKALQISYAKEKICKANIDKELITRLLVNLLFNAVKFSPSGGVVSIDFNIVSNNIKVSIRNQGPSIPKVEQVTIFERFAGTRQANEGKIGSTGLGLTFCKLAVEAHGGQIGVNSEPDKDVEFWFTLPDAECMNCSVCNPLIEYNSIKQFSNEEKELLKPFINQLNNVKWFQVSAINRILNTIKSESENIKQWKKQLEECIYNGNENLYKDLLNKVSSII